MQALLALGLFLVFAVLFYVERNVTVARLVAQRWAPALRQAAGAPGDTAVGAPLLWRSEQPPEPVLRSRLASPRMAALADELRAQGVPLQALAFGREAGETVLWLRLRGAAGTPLWLGVPGEALVPRLPGRLLLAMLIAGVLLAGASWWFTRRLTRPLEQLRLRMAAHRPGDPGPAPDLATEPAISSEVAAIAAAYDELLQRQERHERERALLLAGISHDLRSPLARIRMAAGLLPDDPAIAPRRESIVRNTQVADRLIGSFLDHVRAGEAALDETVDLAEIARAAAAAPREGGALQLDAPAALRVGHASTLLIERLVANLVDNAFVHGRPPVGLRIAADGTQALIEVSDAGPGLPAGRRDELQQAFARGDAARGAPGTGLGLAIVARIVGRMGGTLEFRHEGARHLVRVRLPGLVPGLAAEFTP